MSVALMSLALRQRIPDRTAKLVLIAFAEHADNDGLSWPSVDLVAAEAECSGRTVQRIVKRFVADGLLVMYRVAKGRSHPVVYRVVPEAIGTAPEYWQLREAQRLASHPVHGDSGAPDADDSQGDLLGAKGDAQVSPISTDAARPMGDENSRKGDKSGLMGDTQVSSEVRTFNHKESARADPVDNLGEEMPRKPINEPAHAGHPSIEKPPPRKPRRASAATSKTEPPQDVRQMAKAHDLPQRQHSETAAAFRNRINDSVSKLAALENSCRALRIGGRRHGELLDRFDRRVSNAMLDKTGHHEILNADDARAQARAAVGLDNPGRDSP